MATIARLLSEGGLFEIEPVDPGWQPYRRMFGAPTFRKFLEAVPAYGSCWNIDMSPAEQLQDLLTDFLGTEPLYASRRFGPIRPARGDPWPGVWELKTADLRIFGWFPKQNHFIAVEGSTTQLVKEHNLYGGFREAVVRCRARLPLDEPKYVAGKEFGDVVSLLYQP